MNQLELGMSKEQVIKVLGKQYTISEKRKENGIEIEVFSYRDLYFPNEFYLFSFVDNKLEKWHKETQPTYEVKTNKQ